MEDAKGKTPVAVFDLDGTVILENMAIMMLEQMARQQLLGGGFNSMALRLLARKKRLSIDQLVRWLVRLLLLGLRGQRQTDINTLVSQQVVNRSCDNLSRFVMALFQQLRPTHFCLAITGSSEETA